jgi:hypothetical protein
METNYSKWYPSDLGERNPKKILYDDDDDDDHVI